MTQEPYQPSGPGGRNKAPECEFRRPSNLHRFEQVCSQMAGSANDCGYLQILHGMQLDQER